MSIGVPATSTSPWEAVRSAAASAATATQAVLAGAR